MNKFIFLICLELFFISSFSQNTYEFLDVNNINAGFNADGVLFMTNKIDTIVEGANSYTFYPSFNTPKGTAKNSIFAANLWVSGIDDGGMLYLAANTYKQGGTDFWAGPIANVYNPIIFPAVYDSTYDSTYNYVWKINKTEIQNHVNNYNSSGYIMPWVIATWPGNGNILNGMPAKLAPFNDLNNNGTYEPNLGEYPKILGDQAVFFIFNDDRGIHSQTGGPKLGIEIHAMAYAFDDITNKDLHNTIFINYTIYNRSQRNYNNFQVGLWTDFDMGCGGNELTGCDTLLNTYFVYKGLPTDTCGTFSYIGYGNFPPAQGITFLNSKMTSFIRYFNTQDQINGNPINFYQVNNYINGSYKDGSDILRPNAPFCSMDSGGTETKFLFHDDPNDTSPIAFSEYNCGGSLTDSRTVGTTGNLSLPAGGKICLDLALPFAQDSNGTHLTSVTKLKERIAAIQNYYDNNVLGCAALATSVNDYNLEDSFFSIYPNPANDEFVISINSLRNAFTEVVVYDVNGKLVFEERLSNSKFRIDTQKWNSGIYFVRVISNHQSLSKRVVKL
jgi:hypothetical protein